MNDTSLSKAVYFLYCILFLNILSLPRKSKILKLSLIPRNLLILTPVQCVNSSSSSFAGSITSDLSCRFLPPKKLMSAFVLSLLDYCNYLLISITAHLTFKGLRIVPDPTILAFSSSLNCLQIRP